MTRLLFTVVLFFSLSSQAQLPHTNDPERVYPLLSEYLIEAGLRGLNLRAELSEIDSILVLNRGVNEHRYWGNVCTIELDEESFNRDWEIRRNLAHEIGHHLRVNHCPFCGLSIMSEFKWSGLRHMYSNPINHGYFYDHYFDIIKNPKKHNESHKHF